MEDQYICLMDCVLCSKKTFVVAVYSNWGKGTEKLKTAADCSSHSLIRKYMIFNINTDNFFDNFDENPQWSTCLQKTTTIIFTDSNTSEVLKQFIL